MPKKIPMRMCVGCVSMFSKRELVRIVKNKDGDINIDFTGKMAGRGAYICKNMECLEKAIKTKKLERTFDTKIPDEVYEKLKEELSKGE